MHFTFTDQFVQECLSGPVRSIENVTVICLSKAQQQQVKECFHIHIC